MTQAHSLANTQTFVIERDSFGKVAQACIAFKDKDIDSKHPQQVAHSQTCWPCTYNDDREVWWRWCAHGIFYTFLMANTTFAPPMPRPPMRAVECDKGRASFCTRFKPYRGISCSQLIVGGIIPYRNASNAVIVSSAPAAAKLWPDIVRGTLTGRCCRCVPNVRCSASTSARSERGFAHPSRLK